MKWLFSSIFLQLIGSFFLAYPCAGSLSRSALVANRCGSDCTPMHGIFTAALVLLVLLFLTPTFQPMPNAVLASIVFMAVKSLCDTQKPIYLYKVPPCCSVDSQVHTDEVCTSICR